MGYVFGKMLPKYFGSNVQEFSFFSTSPKEELLDKHPDFNFIFALKCLP